MIVRTTRKTDLLYIFLTMYSTPMIDTRMSSCSDWAHGWSKRRTQTHRLLKRHQSRSHELITLTFHDRTCCNVSVTACALARTDHADVAWYWLISVFIIIILNQQLFAWLKPPSEWPVPSYSPSWPISEIDAVPFDAYSPSWPISAFDGGFSLGKIIDKG